uniref:Uncharacterized protein n=1 Tax=Arundo donax TaxID=35708 RepID=A0A0A9A663_ARUDO
MYTSNIVTFFRRNKHSNFKLSMPFIGKSWSQRTNRIPRMLTSISRNEHQPKFKLAEMA